MARSKALSRADLHAPMTWDFPRLAELCNGALGTAENELREEQSVRGLDDRSEVEVQALIANELAFHHEVHREVHYPSSFALKLSHRMRCDFVLTERGYGLEASQVQANLFDKTDKAPAEEALWIEVKLLAQFREGGNLDPRYQAQWVRGLATDIKKIQDEPRIRRAALLVVAFTDSQATLSKDLALCENLLLNKDLMVGFPIVRHVPIVERHGHRVCTVILWSL